MSKNVTEKIKDKAFELLKDNPDGLRYSELVKFISENDEKLNRNTINGSIWNLDSQFPEKVYKPSRGLFRLVEFKDPETDELRKEVQPKEAKKIKEEDFYEPFSNWLQNDIEDVTHSIPLGGNRFKDKWGTPDVIGKKESKRSDIIQAPVEIVSAEIKTETNQLITAFGQACAYKLFSHKCYLVIPKQSSQDEVARLDSLCQLFGIGLVLFNVENPNTPDFTIRVRPNKHEPDFFYTNKYMSKIEKELFQ
ncbi:MAG: hypothetical protein JRD93_14285 [Deltaproteobacteria bacterium]|nr:hypothetical protein [Deltaproteobacteria bacterium]